MSRNVLIDVEDVFRRGATISYCLNDDFSQLVLFAELKTFCQCQRQCQPEIFNAARIAELSHDVHGGAVESQNYTVFHRKNAALGLRDHNSGKSRLIFKNNFCTAVSRKNILHTHEKHVHLT